MNEDLQLTAREELAQTIADYLAFHGPRTIDPADMAYQLTVSLGLIGLERVAVLLRDAGYQVRVQALVVYEDGEWMTTEPSDAPPKLPDVLVVAAKDAS